VQEFFHFLCLDAVGGNTANDVGSFGRRHKFGDRRVEREVEITSPKSRYFS
jgi:hypothetical protein